MNSSLSLQSLRYGHRQPLFAPLTLACRPGEIWAVLGANGRGKSTLLDTLTGVLPPLGGEMQCEGGVALVPQSFRPAFRWRVRRFTSPVKSKADVDKLPLPDPEQELGYVMNAVRTIRRELKGEVPLIGFSGSPWTLATYMVEGGSSKAFTVIKKMMYAEPQALHALLDKLAKSVTLYLNAQIKAGAQSVMIFDTWGGVLTGRDYQQFSLYYMHKIVDGLLRENEGRRVPVTLFTKGGGQWLEAMAETGCDALGLDWTTDIADARRRVGNKVALQGNMDPSMLYASAPRIEEEVATILAGFGQGEGHVFNLGHGIHQDVDPEHAGVFVEAVHRLSAPYHQ